MKVRWDTTLIAGLSNQLSLSFIAIYLSGIHMVKADVIIAIIFNFVFVGINQELNIMRSRNIDSYCPSSIWHIQSAIPTTIS